MSVAIPPKSSSPQTGPPTSGSRSSARRRSAASQPELDPRRELPSTGQPTVSDSSARHAAAPTNTFPAGAAERAASPVLLRMLSGEDVGQFVAIDSDRFTVGSRADVSFPAQRAMGLPSKAAKIRREAEGWVLRPASGQRMFVNTTPVTGKVSLRSGDVVRLSLDGPDFQFLIQHHNQRSLAAIAKDYAPRMLVSTTVADAIDATLAAPTAAATTVSPKRRGPVGQILSHCARWARRNRIAAIALGASGAVALIAAAVWLVR